MVQTIHCHYARASLYSLHKSKQPVVEAHAKFVLQFGCDTTAKSLGDGMRGLASTMQKKWCAGESVKAYLEVFSKENWVKLRQGEKLKHSVRDCTPCRGKRHWNNAYPGKSVTCNTKDTAQMQKQSQADKKQEKRHYAKKFKVTMEAQWAASECDFNNLFADKTSSAAYERQRMRWCFETVPSAEDRRARGQIKRRHSPTTMPFRTEDLIAEAENFQPGCSINWTKLARKYDVPGANGGGGGGGGGANG